MSLKAKWIFSTLDDPFWEVTAYTHLDSCIKENIWRCNLACDDVDAAIPMKSFWRQVLYAWARYNFKEILSPNEVYDTIIWFNSCIRVDGSILMSHAAWNAGLVKVSQLFDDNGVCYSYAQIVAKYGSVFTWYQYQQIISAIPTPWRQYLKTKSNTVVNVYRFDWLKSKTGVASIVYDGLIDNKTLMLKKKRRWESRLHIDIEDESFLKLFHSIYHLTLCTKFRDFQFRLLHNIIVTNQKLFLWKLIDSNLCSFCKAEVETTLHLFCYCKKVLELWDDIDLYFQTNASLDTTKDLIWSEENILFNLVHPKESHVINFIVLITKQYIYRQRCAGRQLYSNLLIKEIENIQQIEYEIAKSKGKLRSHLNKWAGLHVQLTTSQNDINAEQDYIQLYLQRL